MHTKVLLLLLTSCVSALATTNILKDPTQAEFETYLQDNERILTAFTSQSLDSVASLQTIFTQAAINSSTPFVTINCDLECSLCTRFDINTYPTIRLFEHNAEGELQSTRYRGRQTSGAIKSFLKKRELPVLSHLEVLDSRFRRIDSIVVIAFLAPDDTASLRTLKTIANRHHFDFVFGYVTDASIAEKEKVTIPSIICYRNNDGDNVILNNSFSEADVEEFLVVARKSWIGDFREKDIDAYMRRDKLTVYIFVTSSSDTTALRHELTPLANAYQQYVTFGVVDTGRYSEMPANFGVEIPGDQALVVHAPVNDEVFMYKSGKAIERVVVERMLMKILKGRAKGGEVFGEEAEGNRGGREIHEEL
jgi:protein disulfide-isomerase A1